MKNYRGNPHFENFRLWLERVEFWLRSERGRSARLARALKVNRQQIHRWFILNRPKPPGWAAVTANVFYYQNVSPQADSELRHLQQNGPLSLPRRTSQKPPIQSTQALRQSFL